LKDLGRKAEVFIETFPVGCFQCNCTVLGCERTGEAVIIDPGDDEEKILKIIKQQGFQVKSLLHTHAHLDHIGMAGPLKRKGYGEIFLHKDDEFLYDSLEEQGKLFGLSLQPKDEVDEHLSHKDQIEFGDHVLSVIHTPGHTPGSCSFLLEKKGILFSGDTLFQSSIGRTDLPGGDFNQIVDSIKNRIFNLKKDYSIIPGHGPNTTLAYEAKSNPFVKL
jgi:hydroxyacylglutathione hydrolase